MREAFPAMEYEQISRCAGLIMLRAGENRVSLQEDR